MIVEADSMGASELFLPPYGYIIRSILYGIGAIKCLEISVFTLWVLRHGTTYRKALIRRIKPGLNIKFTADDVRQVNVLCRHPVPAFQLLHSAIENCSLRPKLFKKFLCWVFLSISVFVDRQPVIVLIYSSLLVLYPNKVLSSIDSFILILIVYLELIDLIVARCVLGFADNFRVDFTFHSYSIFMPNHAQRAKSFRIATDHFLPKFMKGIGIFIGTAWIAFACLFWNANHLISPSGSQAFDGLLSNTPVFPQCLYFSLVTLTTVGYGDISPETILTQFYASLEIVLGLSTLVFLFFALANTFAYDGRDYTKPNNSLYSDPAKKRRGR